MPPVTAVRDRGSTLSTRPNAETSRPGPTGPSLRGAVTPLGFEPPRSPATTCAPRAHAAPLASEPSPALRACAPRAHAAPLASEPSPALQACAPRAHAAPLASEPSPALRAPV